MAKNQNNSQNNRSRSNSFGKTGKLFGKISIIDIIVVVCIAVLAFGIYAKYTSDSDATQASQKTTFEFVYKVKDVRDYTVTALEKGGAVYNTETKEYIGEVVGVRAEDAVKEISLVDGTYKQLVVPEKYDVYVTIRATGKYNSLGYYTETNAYIGAGSTLNAKSKFATTEGSIVDVYDVE